MNRDDIPEDFMVILDYNMDEKNEEEEEQEKDVVIDEHSIDNDKC